jgi:hypothetical protein
MKRRFMFFFADANRRHFTLLFPLAFPATFSGYCCPSCGAFFSSSHITVAIACKGYIRANARFIVRLVESYRFPLCVFFCAWVT